jgi:two-component system, OmpR family, response regulator
MLPMQRLILLAEDDPITREVVATHLRNLGLRVEATASVSEARVLASRETYSALVFDRNLQGGDAISLLADIRGNSGHLNAGTPAIAMSAELHDADVDQLLAAGFADAIEKPVSLLRLQLALAQCGVACAGGCAEPAAALAPQLIAACTGIEVLDDDLGVQACGSTEVLSGLRGLLAIELPGYLSAIAAAMARQDALAVDEVLHRLKSALGFCGAREMLQLLQRLQIAPLQHEHFDALRAGAQRLIDRLDAVR